MADDLEEAIERLHSGSLKSFVARRKDIAKELRAAGDKEAARTVMGIAKPTLAAWVVNQLARRHRATIDALLSAIDRQRDLQLGALSGELDAGALSAAKDEEKAQMSTAAELAAEVLEADGHAASKTNLDRVRKALRAAALDAAQRALVESGTLLKDEGEGGFDAVASQLDPALLLAALNAKSTKPAPKKRKVDGMFARSARSDAGRAAEPETRAVKSTRSRAAQAEQDKQQRLAAAKVAAAKAREGIAAQRAQVVACEERIVQLENDLTAARAEARSARRKLSDLKHRLEQADKRIRLLET